MKVNFSTHVYKSKYLKKGLEFVADNGALFSAGASLALATVARPLSIWLTPKTDKENRKLACAKSIASAGVGFGIMAGVSLPVASSIKKIDKNPEKYLKSDTINTLKEVRKPLVKSKPYKFVTQLFRLGLGAVVALPKAVVTCALIPSIMGVFFKDNQKKSPVLNEVTPDNRVNATSSNPNFKGKIKPEPLTKTIAKIIDFKPLQNFSNRLKDSNYPMHVSALTDTVATATFIAQTKTNKKIKEDRKNTLIYNSAIATGLSIGLGYVADKMLNKPTEKFIAKFKEANKNSPKLDKYVDGIKIAKPALILGILYYCAIPLVSTFFAERIDKKEANSHK